MTQEEKDKLIEEIGQATERYREQFSHWYDQANMLDVKEYCFWGWLLDRKIGEEGPK